MTPHFESCARISVVLGLALLAMPLLKGHSAVARRLDRAGACRLGLDALLGDSSDMSEDEPVVAGAPSVMAVTELQAGKYQPRSRMDEGALNELAASIKIAFT